DALTTGADVAQGRTEPEPSQPRGPFSHTIEIRAEYGWYETCNIAYRRSMLESLGGFDERFTLAYGEDTDLAWRAPGPGGATVFADDALVYHSVSSSSWRARVRDARRRAQMVLVVRNNPELRRKLRGGFFLDESHPSALLAAAGVALAASRPTSVLRVGTGAAAQLPYIRFRTRYKPVPARRCQWPWVL